MNGYKTLDTLSRRTRRQTPRNDEDRDEDKQGEENTSILFRLSSCRATVLVKQVTRDRTVHSRLHPRFDQFRSDLSPPPPPPYQPFWTYYATIITIHKRERHYFILVWKFSWTSKPRVGLKHVVPPLSVHFPSIMYIRRWLTRSRIVRDKILDSNEGGDWKRLKTIWHVASMNLKLESRNKKNPVLKTVLLRFSFRRERIPFYFRGSIALLVTIWYRMKNHCEELGRNMKQYRCIFVDDQCIVLW